MGEFYTLEFHETVPRDEARALVIKLFLDCIEREGFGHSYVVFTGNAKEQQLNALHASGMISDLAVR